MTALRTVISDLEPEAFEVIESSASAPDEKVMSIAFLRSMASAGTSTDPGMSDEDDPPGEVAPEEVAPEEVAPAEDAPAEDAPADYPPAE
jgi:hypothetical protein